MSKYNPKPLFDTLEYIDKPASSCVQNFLQTLNIRDCEREFQLCREFLANYTGSSDTFNAYRRDLERFLQWSWLEKQKPLIELDRNDLREYIDFVNAPPKSWIGIKNVRRFLEKDGERRFNPEWHPFTARVSKIQASLGVNPDKENFKLSPKSIRALLAVLSSFFSYCQEEDYLQVNPVQLIRQKSRYIQKVQQEKVTRKLSDLQWKTVIESAEKLTTVHPKYYRTYFIMSAFYLLGLRISELSVTPGRIPVMGDFAPDKDGLWWFKTVSKGNKLRDVAVPDELLDILKQYRISRGLPPLPHREEQTPLLHKNRGAKNGLGPRQVRNIVQECFDYAIAQLVAAGETDQAQDLQTATVHWLRHTAISSDIQYRPKEHILDDVGHENPATMYKYVDTDRHARHQSAKHKTLKPFQKENNDDAKV